MEKALAGAACESEESEPLEAMVARAPARAQEAWRLACAGQRIREPLRAPTLGLYPGLRAQPWWPAAELGSWLSALEAALPVLRREFDALAAAAGGLEPLEASVAAGGRWHAGYLQREGRPQPCTQPGSLCAGTWAALQAAGAPLLHGCALGFAYFSVLAPGTRVQAHCGPSNVRLRVHIPLHVPAGCWLEVAGTRAPWHEGQALVFDDSYLHAAHCPAEAGRARVVLLLDVWHPDLQPIERQLLLRALPATDRAD